MQVRHIMTPNPEFLTPDAPVREAATRMRNRDVGLLPIVDDGDALRLLGVISDRDIAIRHVAEGCEGCAVQKHMTAEKLIQTSPEADVHEVTRAMKDAQVRRVPVTDEGRLVGILAQADIAIQLGEDEPEEVEDVVEKISRPTPVPG